MSAMFSKIGFIGTGHMGAALARAAAKGAGELLLANRTPAKAQALAQELGCTACGNEEVAKSCDVIFLGVKPQMMEGLLRDIGPILRQRTDRFVLISMAAGLTARRIQEMAGDAFPVIRIMPNTPVALGEGVVEYCALDATQEELDAFAALMAPAGLVDRVDEGAMDAASALSGCGPAFLYLVLEAMADGAVACGLPRDKAVRYAAQTMAGTARLALESGEHTGALKDAVCSPGGSTIQGVRAMERQGVRSAVMEAVIAAFEKNRDLGR